MRIFQYKYLISIIIGFLLKVSPIWACSTCIGQASGPQADAVRWSMLTLLLITIFVLASFASIIIYLFHKKSKEYPDYRIKGSESYN